MSYALTWTDVSFLDAAVKVGDDFGHLRWPEKQDLRPHLWQEGK